MMLYTPDGLRRWGDLRVGDLVFAQDGSPTRITRVHDNGVVPLYRVTFDDGSSTLAGAEHWWKVRGRSERRYWKWDQQPRSKRSQAYSKNNRVCPVDADGYAVLTTAQIVERNKAPDGARRQFEIPRQGAAQFAHRDLPVDPYVLGVWLGDGGRRSGRYTSADPEIVEEITRRGYRQSAPNGLARTIYGMASHLRDLGLLHKYSYEKSVPMVYRVGSVAQRMDLLRGLMDTDGCIGTDRHCEYSTTSLRLAEDVVSLVRSLGGVALIKATRSRKSYRDAQGKKIVCRVCYRVTVTTPFVPFLLPRKAARWRMPQTRYLTRYIDRIDPALPEDAMCIEIAHPSRCYLANDYIVTHNSAVLAWVAWNVMLCYATEDAHPIGAAVSITADNLSNGLWHELAVWYGKAPLLRRWFTMSGDAIRHREHPLTWYLEARSWSKTANAEEQGRTLSGLHGPIILYLVDESGSIAPAVMRSAEQGLSNCQWGKILQAGNPTDHKGVLYQSVTNQAHLWSVTRITGDPDDPQRSTRIDIEWARQQISAWGRDNPWVMAFILGKFPPSALNALLGPDEVAAAMKRTLPEESYIFSQKRIGVDVAAFGDDATILFPRQGLAARNPVELRNARPSAIAARIMQAKQKWGSELELIDSGGGYASGVVDQCRMAGVNLLEVYFSGKADDPRYFNKRAEMAFRCAEWVKTGGCLPNDPQLARELVATTYWFKNGKFQIPEKDQIKKELQGHSPDRADALWTTFALVDLPASDSPEVLGAGMTANHATSDWDPYAEGR